MKKPIIYCAGKMGGLSLEEMSTWRKQFICKFNNSLFDIFSNDSGVILSIVII